jgi:8-oxo-dGTP diphosphatase
VAVPRGAIQAAGGVVWREAADGDGIEVAVIHRPRYDDWTLPKGKLAAGESHLEGALREIREETGQRVEPGGFLGEIRYRKESKRGMRDKVVRYWEMRALGGEFSPSREVDILEWLKPEMACSALTRETDREILERFTRLLPRGGTHP